MKKLLSVLVIASVFAACNKDHISSMGKDITKAPHVSVDRFSSAAGTLFICTSGGSLPGPNEPINMDNEPFIVNGLDKNGSPTTYYTFDVQPAEPDDIYAFFKASDPTVEIIEQHHVIPSLPGEADYSDF